eukprot:4115141-Pyramimonas_sp.AAC.1
MGDAPGIPCEFALVGVSWAPLGDLEGLFGRCGGLLDCLVALLRRVRAQVLVWLKYSLGSSTRWAGSWHRRSAHHS